jgi:hypothetical protein
VSCLHVIWSWLLEWFPHILPAIVNALLILAGVVMSLPKLAEKIEDTPKYRKCFAVICIGAGLIGFVFDVRARHDSDKTSSQLLGEVGITLAAIRPSLALPQVWRTNGGHRTTYCCSNPTPFSTTFGEYCRMKRLYHNSKTLHGSPAPPASALPLTRSLLRALFHAVSDHRFLPPHARGSPPPLPCRLPPTSTPLLCSIQFA